MRSNRTTRRRLRDLPIDQLRRDARGASTELANADAASRRVLQALRTGEGVDRRRLFQLGGMMAASGAVLVACGTTDTAGTETVPPRLGTTPTRATLPEAVVNDVVVLRTASSLEYLAIDTYDFVLAELGDLFTGDAAALVPVVQRFRDDHQRHADTVGVGIDELGGERYECANERMRDAYLLPALELILGTETAVSMLGIEGSATPAQPSDDPLGDVLLFAYALESIAGSTYQGVVPLLTLPTLRRDAMTVAAEEARHATVLATVIAPGVLVATEESPVAAVPSTYGQLGQVSIRIGAPNDVGNKTLVSIDTPSLNALVYEYLGPCSR